MDNLSNYGGDTPVDYTQDLLTRRGATHGDFTDHARVTQNLKRAMQASPNWHRISDVQKEALEMIQHKIGRALSGDPDYHDHWIDLEGYTRLVVDRLPYPEGAANG